MRAFGLAALLLLPLPVVAQDCARLSQHFELCTEGTPWAEGTWEQGGDSAALYLGKVGFDGFEDYFSHDPDKTIGAELNSALAQWDETAVITHHQRDKLKSADMTFVRSIDTMVFPDSKPELRVTMIGVSHQERLMVLGRAPEGTDLAVLDQMSRDYAGLVRRGPTTGEE